MKNVFPQFELGFMAEKSLKDVNPFDRVYELINKPSPSDSLGQAFLAGQLSYYLSLYITAFNAVKGTGHIPKMSSKLPVMLLLKTIPPLKPTFPASTLQPLQARFNCESCQKAPIKGLFLCNMLMIVEDGMG